jgi:hypothetical protein
MLTFAFAVTGGSINQECLGYLNRATKSIRQRMSSPENAASVATIGAILLLAGVEVCTPYRYEYPRIFAVLGILES